MILLLVYRYLVNDTSTYLHKYMIIILNNSFFKTVAHEMGHVLGLWHDFMDWHKKIGCDKQGIMSYGNNIPTKWSECSKKDFKAYYNHATKVQGLSWCMERKHKFFYINQT